MSLVGGSVAGAAAVAVGTKLATSESVAVSSTAARANVHNEWSVAEIGHTKLGAQPIMLKNRASGEELRIELCKRGSRLDPVARSRSFDLFLANNGNGSVRTSRDHIVVARNLASKLDRHFAQLPAGVLSMDERQRKHGELFETSDDIA